MKTINQQFLNAYCMSSGWKFEQMIIFFTSKNVENIRCGHCFNTMVILASYFQNFVFVLTSPTLETEPGKQWVINKCLIHE